MSKGRTFSGYSKDSYLGEALTTRYNEVDNFTVKETIEDVLSYPILAVPQRGLTLDSAKRNNIHSTVSLLDGKTVTATYFPYYTKSGELIAFKKRDWTLAKEDKKHFTTVGTLRISCMLFGQQDIPKGGKRLYITEGEEDKIALERALMKVLEHTKWEGKIVPAVVSLSCGTGNAVEAIAHNDEFVRSFQEIILAFDNDHATPKELKDGILKGKEAIEAAAGYLLSDNIYTFEYPKNHKDSRECVNEGLISELGKAASWGVIKYSPEAIVSGNESDIEDLIKPLQEGYRIPRMPKLMEAIHGFRIHELTTYAAFSGVGKSTLAREVAWELIASGKKVGMIFLEEPLIKTQQSLIALQLGIKLNKYRENPLACATREAITEARTQILANGRTFFLDHFGSLKPEKLMQQIGYLHFICGCEQIFIDHVSMVVAGSESQNERKDIDVLFEGLATFMTVNPVGIHAVMHLKRVDDREPSKKDGDEEPKSYWKTVKKEMLRGSSGVECMSSQIIMLENEIMPDGKRGRVRSKVEKNREWSTLGICDTMLMNEQGRLEVVPEDPDWMFNYYAELSRLDGSYNSAQYSDREEF